MNTENNKIFMMVDKDQLQEVVESAMRKVLSFDTKSQSQEVKQLGDYISQSEAMKMLNRKTTWFHLKRKSGELSAKKSANQWWYKRSDLENFVNGGLDPIPNF